MSFRLNAQLTTEAIITSGDGVPGGTGVVLFLDSENSKALKAVLPDGTVVAGRVVDGALIFG